MPGERHPAREPRKDGAGARAAGTQHRDLGHRSRSPGFLVCEGGSSSSSFRRKLLGGSAELLAARPAPRADAAQGATAARAGATGRRCPPATAPSSRSPRSPRAGRRPPCRRGRRARGGNVAELGVTESEASPLSPGASCSSEVDFVPELLWQRGGAVRRDRVTQRPFQGSGVADTDEPASGLVCSFQQRAPLSNLCAPEEEAVGVWGHRETGNQVGGCGCVLLGTPCNLLVLQGACSFVLGGPWLFRDLIIRILRMGGPGQQRGVKPILPFGSGAQDLHFVVGTLRSAHPSSESRVDLGDLEQNSGADGGPGTTRCR